MRNGTRQDKTVLQVVQVFVEFMRHTAPLNETEVGIQALDSKQSIGIMQFLPVKQRILPLDGRNLHQLTGSPDWPSIWQILITSKMQDPQTGQGMMQ